MSTTNGDSAPLRDRPIGEIASELTRDLSLLVRQELELAKAEMAQKGKTAVPGAGNARRRRCSRADGGRSADGLRRAGAGDFPAVVAGGSRCRRRPGRSRRTCSSCVARSRSGRPALRFLNKQSKR